MGILSNTHMLTRTLIPTNTNTSKVVNFEKSAASSEDNEWLRNLENYLIRAIDYLFPRKSFP